MDSVEAIMWCVSGVSLVGTVANLYKRRWCFWLWIGSNTAWVAYDIHKTAYPQAALMAVYACLAVWGLWVWRKEK
jgi:nicotinamide riboside transporter PnuC